MGVISSSRGMSANKKRKREPGRHAFVQLQGRLTFLLFGPQRASGLPNLHDYNGYGWGSDRSVNDVFNVYYFHVEGVWLLYGRR